MCIPRAIMQVKYGKHESWHSRPTHGHAQKRMGPFIFATLEPAEPEREVPSLPADDPPTIGGAQEGPSLRLIRATLAKPALQPLAELAYPIRHSQGVTPVLGEAYAACGALQQVGAQLAFERRRASEEVESPSSSAAWAMFCLRATTVNSYR